MFVRNILPRVSAIRALNVSKQSRSFTIANQKDELDQEISPEEQEKLFREFLNSQNGETEANLDAFSDLDNDILNDPQFDLTKNTTPDVAAREDIAMPSNTEKRTTTATSHKFETETRQILDIVINSLYTDKEVFLRELVSNGSDALEKAAFLKSSNELIDEHVPFEIRIFTDETNNTITIQDTGIGMTAEELVTNLGTIAKSGSKQWVKEMSTKGGANSNIIGQFGVGFYAGYMVGHSMEVYSQSARRPTDGTERYPANYWTSEGTGAYEMAQAEGVERGTKIVIHLRDDCKSYSMRSAIENIIKKYSNFVGYPIFLNGVRLNTIQAIWNLSKNEVTEEQHAEFYRYYTGAYDTPAYRMHFNTDAPLQINALFYFPERHMEKFGMGRMEYGTSLYSRKILIKSKAAGLLPEYFRFVQGVVDSEDIPLNISRENMQDSLLITRISSVLTKRVIRFLQDESKKDTKKYLAWYSEFNAFLKEGVCSDFTHKNELARLLRFDSSFSSDGESVSLDDYISRMPPSQQNIYYLCAPNRATALSSPYYEGLKDAGYEVLFLYHTLDDFVMQNLRDYNKRKIVSAESGNTEITNNDDAETKAEREAENADLISYLKETLGSKVSTISISTRLTSHPAVVVDHESAAVRKMMKMMDNAGFGDLPIAKQKLEVNPTHPIFVKMLSVKDTKPAVAKAVAEQIFDNALLAADILDNPRSILARMNVILESALDK